MHNINNSLIYIILYLRIINIMIQSKKIFLHAYQRGKDLKRELFIPAH